MGVESEDRYVSYGEALGVWGFGVAMLATSISLPLIWMAYLDNPIMRWLAFLLLAVLIVVVIAVMLISVGDLSSKSQNGREETIKDGWALIKFGNPVVLPVWLAWHFFWFLWRQLRS